ncbi:MCE family protein [Amycolatopsis sp. K13G38]|uniref:MCE family protein n=1 Tax=Amycolatopsis acididurans TaxID=2724524 RepID=A0ABX1J945_9PSEU|nr:MCE family protein [Amycolatopsis acididurans]NKQ56228.1 MCE family protein [Amycolatopsis acididurans]
MRRLLVLCAVMFLVAGCGSGGFSGLYNAPLPGGADLGDHPFHITARFTDVLDLVPQASVKVNDVAVGRVDRIDLAPDTHSALVSMTVNASVRLPANAFAGLRQSSLLGEKFVELAEPAGEAPTGSLGEGALIPLSRTSRHPEIEEVLGALSMLLNGGGVNQLAGITTELNRALLGNEPKIRALLSGMDALMTELDGQKADIVRAIDGLHRLSGTLDGQTANLTKALRDLAPGLQVVAEQRDQLVGMLSSLNSLSGVAVDTMYRSRDQVVANLRALEPTLTRLAEAGQNLPTALKILPTYPLPDEAGIALKGDYGNVSVNLDLDLSAILSNIENAGKVSISLPGAAAPVTIPAGAPPLPLPVPSAPAQSGSPGGPLVDLLGGGR